MVALGTNMDPHQAFLVLRGVKTLGLRVERAQEGRDRGRAVAQRALEVAWVRYIGLPSHPQYELAKRQMTGPGSMIGFELHGGVVAGAAVMDHVKLAASPCCSAESNRSSSTRRP